MKKSYEKPTLVRRQNLARVTADNGDMVIISAGVNPN